MHTLTKLSFHRFPAFSCLLYSLNFMLWTYLQLLLATKFTFLVFHSCLVAKSCLILCDPFHQLTQEIFTEYLQWYKNGLLIPEIWICTIFIPPSAFVFNEISCLSCWHQWNCTVFLGYNFSGEDTCKQLYGQLGDFEEFQHSSDMVKTWWLLCWQRIKGKIKIRRLVRRLEEISSEICLGWWDEMPDIKCVDFRETQKLKLIGVGGGMMRAREELRITIGSCVDSSSKNYRCGEYRRGKHLCGERWWSQM